MQPFDNHILQWDLTFFFMENWEPQFLHFEIFNTLQRNSRKHITVPEWENEKRNTEVGTLFDYGAKCCSSPRHRVITHLERRQNSACQPRAAAEATEAAASKQTVHWILEKASKRCTGFRNSNTEERTMICPCSASVCLQLLVGTVAGQMQQQALTRTQQLCSLNDPGSASLAPNNYNPTL
jgi:hypothetical protein